MYGCNFQEEVGKTAMKLHVFVVVAILGSSSVVGAMKTPTFGQSPGFVTLINQIQFEANSPAPEPAFAAGMAPEMDFVWEPFGPAPCPGPDSVFVNAAPPFEWPAPEPVLGPISAFESNFATTGHVLSAKKRAPPPPKVKKVKAKSPPPPKKSPPPPKPKSPPPPKPKSPPPPKPKSPPPPKPKSPPPPKPKSPPPPKPQSPPPPKFSPPPPPKYPPPPPKYPPPPPKYPPPPPNYPPPPKYPPPPPIPPPPPVLPSEPWNVNYENLWTPPQGGIVVSPDGMDVDLKITSQSQAFAHFISKDRFMFGYFSMEMKLVANNSAGVDMSYYFSSPIKNQNSGEVGDVHDELDFEFLGNVSGQPITLQTNVYLNGAGNREQRHFLPFDPTADFHKYSLLWNENLIIWYIDDEPIRVYHNKSATVSAPYPTTRPMAVECSIWNASTWATEGGKITLNISYAPFVVSYQGFGGVAGCACCDTVPFTDPNPNCNATSYADCFGQDSWYQQQTELTSSQIAYMRTYQPKYLQYDYCKDYNRFPHGIPDECPYNTYY